MAEHTYREAVLANHRLDSIMSVTNFDRTYAILRCQLYRASMRVRCPVPTVLVMLLFAFVSTVSYAVDRPFQDYLIAWQSTWAPSGGEANFNGKQVMLGDCNDDGALDLYVASNFDGRVIILDGANRFRSYLLPWQSTYIGNFDGKQVMLGDYNNDDGLHLYVASNFDGRVIILDDGSSEVWTFRLREVVISDPLESGGDEPFFLLFGFRSRVDDPGSTSVVWRGALQRVSENHKCCRPVSIPELMGSFSWSNINSTEEDLSRGGPDVIGAVVVAMEKEGCPWGSIRDKVLEVRKQLEQEIENLIARGDLGDIVLNPDEFERDLAEAERRISDQEADSGILDELGSIIACGLGGGKPVMIGSHVVLFVPYFLFGENRAENRYRLQRNRTHISIPLQFDDPGVRWRVPATMDLRRSRAR